MNATRKYTLACLITIVAAVAVCLGRLLLPNGFWATALVWAALFACFFSIRIYARIFLFRILLDDLDPERFRREVLECRFLRLPKSYRILCALYGGDYDTATALCEGLLEEESLRPADKSACFITLARCCLERGDRTGLAAVCSRYDQWAAVSGDRAGTMDYYRHFAAGQYEQCLQVCLTKSSGSAKRRFGKVPEVKTCLLTGFAYAALGRREEASAQFQALIRIGPKLHAACIAQTYLETGLLPPFQP